MKRAFPDLETWRDSQRPPLTQREAAERFGMSQAQWSRIEAGKIRPRGKLLKRLTVETGVPLEVLVGIAS